MLRCFVIGDVTMSTYATLLNVLSFCI